MATVAFTVPGEPVAKGRPRVYRVHGMVRTVTPPDTVRYEQHVRNCAMLSGVTPLDGALRAELVFQYAMPSSQHRKRDPRPAAPRLARPDCDNLAKAVLDALNGIAYADDAQVVDLRVSKYNAAQGEPALCHVRVEQIQ